MKTRRCCYEYSATGLELKNVNHGARDWKQEMVGVMLNVIRNSRHENETLVWSGTILQLFSAVRSSQQLLTSILLDSPNTRQKASGGRSCSSLSDRHAHARTHARTHILMHSSCISTHVGVQTATEHFSAAQYSITQYAHYPIIWTISTHSVVLSFTQHVQNCSHSINSILLEQ